MRFFQIHIWLQPRHPQNQFSSEDSQDESEDEIQDLMRRYIMERLMKKKRGGDRKKKVTIDEAVPEDVHQRENTTIAEEV